MGPVEKSQRDHKIRCSHCPQKVAVVIEWVASFLLSANTVFYQIQDTFISDTLESLSWDVAYNQWLVSLIDSSFSFLGIYKITMCLTIDGGLLLRKYNLESKIWVLNGTRV